MSAARLFVALVPPVTVQTELAGLAAPLAGVRWTPAPNIHLTLRFIGETAPDKQARFEEALAGVRVEPFILPVSGAGTFTGRGPARVLWAGVGTGHTRLYQLRKQVDEALLTVDAGLPMPGFHPHFTLARLDPGHEPKALAHFIAQHADMEAPPFRVTEFQLLASDLQTAPTPVYRAVRNFLIAG
jgi:2'-5' RNA ligase